MPSYSLNPLCEGVSLMGSFFSSFSMPNFCKPIIFAIFFVLKALLTDRGGGPARRRRDAQGQFWLWRAQFSGFGAYIAAAVGANALKCQGTSPVAAGAAGNWANPFTTTAEFAILPHFRQFCSCGKRIG